MTELTKNKFKKLFSPLIALIILAIIFVSAINIFNSSYYKSFYVVGESMSPTLKGASITDPTAEYGFYDDSDVAKKAVKRFQIVTTLYPNDKGSMKIKRVTVLPNETFEIIDNKLYIYKNDFPIYIKNNFDYPKGTSLHSYPKTTLKDNEYFLLGDNVDNSIDSYDLGPITYDNLIGVVTEIKGTCTIDYSQDMKVTNEKPYQFSRRFFGVNE